MDSTHLRASRAFFSAFFRFTVLTSSSVFLTAHSAKCRYRGAVKRGLIKNHRPQRACVSVSPLVRGAFYSSEEGLQKRVFALVIRGFEYMQLYM